MQIVVKIKSVYGNDLIYPVCETAKLFAALTGKRTFGPDDIANIKALGYSIALGNENSTFDRLLDASLA